MKNQKQEIVKLIEDAVNKGASTAEEIHRAVADLPVTVLEDLGMGADKAQEAKRLQDTSIGAIYDLVRDINHSVAELAGDIIEKVQSQESTPKELDDA